MNITMLMKVLAEAGAFEREVESLDLTLKAEEGGKPLRIRIGETESADETEEAVSVTPPSRLCQEEAGENVAKDMLGLFIGYIESYLRGVFYDDDAEEYHRLSATTMQVNVDIAEMCDHLSELYSIRDGAELRDIVFNEIPNIIKIYEKVGWEVSLENERIWYDNLRNGTLIFVGELPPSPYRKLLSDEINLMEGVKLSKPEETAEVMRKADESE